MRGLPPLSQDSMSADLGLKTSKPSSELEKRLNSLFGDFSRKPIYERNAVKIPIISDSTQWQHYEFEPIEEEEQQKAVKEAMNALVGVLDDTDYFPAVEEWIERGTCRLMGIDYATYTDSRKRGEYFNKNPNAELEFVEKYNTVCIAYDRLMGGIPHSGELPGAFVSRSKRNVPTWAKFVGGLAIGLLALAAGHYFLNVFLPQHSDSDGDGLPDDLEAILGTNPKKKNPNVAYAYNVKKLPANLSKAFAVYDDDEIMSSDERAAIDYVAHIPSIDAVSQEVLKYAPPEYKSKVISELQNKATMDLTRDGKAPEGAAKALQYLSGFDGPTQRERIEDGLDQASIKQLSILASHPDQRFAQWAVRQRLGLGDHNLSQLEADLLANPSVEDYIVKSLNYYLGLLENSGDPVFLKLAEEIRNLPDYKPDLKNVERIEDIVHLALDGKPYAKYEDRFDAAKITRENEVYEAFELMLKGGVPDPKDYRYPVPKWNTELQILGWLAERNEFKRSDTLAQAIAMVNGLWVTMGTEEVKQAVYKDVNDVLNLFRETNEIQRARGYYQLEDYPLEAKVALVWTGNDLGRGGHIHYQLMSGGPKSADPINIHPFIINEFRPVSLKDYEWNTVSIGTLREMRKFLDDGWVSNDVDMLVAKLEKFFYFNGKKHWVFTQPNDAMIEVDNELTVNHNMNNADFEFQYFLKHGKGIGVCDDEMTLIDAFLKSWGIPSLPLVRTYAVEPRSNHTHIIYYGQQSKTWKAYEEQLSIGMSSSWNVYVFRPPIKQFNYFKYHRDDKQWFMKMPNLYHKMLNIDGYQAKRMFLEGLSTSTIKKGILYSD